jgi:hypothetical protein
VLGKGAGSQSTIQHGEAIVLDEREARANSHRLTAINAAQLTIALISNLALLMNMAHRIRFSVAQPVTIVGWYVKFS